MSGRSSCPSDPHLIDRMPRAEADLDTAWFVTHDARLGLLGARLPLACHRRIHAASGIASTAQGRLVGLVATHLGRALGALEVPAHVTLRRTLRGLL